MKSGTKYWMKQDYPAAEAEAKAKEELEQLR